MTGIIYRAYCVKTNKSYIGQTQRKLQERITQHKSESFNEESPGYLYHFHRAIRKYGFDSFQWEILETVDCDKASNLQELLNYLETKYITMYDSYHNGYNSTSGGKQSSSIIPKEIWMYLGSGDKIGKFSSAREIEQIYGISRSVIYNICNRNSKFTFRQGQFYVFRYDGDTFTENEISEVKKFSEDSIITMYDMKGLVIEVFSSTSQILDKLGIDRVKVNSCCRREQSFVQLNNYQKVIFRKGLDECTKKDLIIANSIKSGPKKYVKAIDLVTNEILGIFPSMSEGGKTFNVQPGKIGECCSGKRKSSGKFKGHKIRWEYSNFDEYNKYTR